MTPDQQLDAEVAQTLGWTDLAAPHGRLFGNHPDPDIGRTSVPRYGSDLNACAEMEATLTDTEKRDYIDALKIALRAHGGTYRDVWLKTTATAPQRRAAFLAVKKGGGA